MDTYESLLESLTNLYKDVLPVGFKVSRVAIYDPVKHSAPNLYFEKKERPLAEYLINIQSDTSSIPALGVSIDDAIKRAVVKATVKDT